MKRICKVFGFFAAFCCALCIGCTSNQEKEAEPESALVLSDTEDTQTENENETVSLIRQYGLDILPSIKVEAGSPALLPEYFFENYENQEIEVGQSLTADELAVCKAVYQIPVTYQEHDLTIEVEIVDTTAPVITKVSDILVKSGDTVAYKKAVEYSDNSSNALTLSIDNSAVDLQTPGEYSVSYTVTDEGGNTATIDVPLTVVEATSHTEDDVRDLALAVVEEIVDENASKYDNAKELFQWVHSNIRYQHAAGDRSSVWAGAYEGLHDGAGDCYAFYATYSVLLTYAGIDNLCVARVSDSSHHWWNLVNTGDGWYHCDASPRRNGDRYYCFMQTDAQVAAYTRAYPEKPDYYTFDGSLLPERETTIIVGYDPDTIYEKYNTDAVERYLASIRKEAEDDEEALTDDIDQDADLEIEENEAENEADNDAENEADNDADDDDEKTDKKKDNKNSKKKKSDESDIKDKTSNPEDTQEEETTKSSTEKKKKKKSKKTEENQEEVKEESDSGEEPATEDDAGEEAAEKS
ncbi:MAG: hypothetical protein MR016_07215 [Agathobacter sp.]|nr:hypothetical protein [Agathobacter sp.]